MAESTSAYTVADLVLLVAEQAGFADYDSEGIAMIPVNSPHDLNKCVRIVNEAIRMFISDAPVTGWRWRKRIYSQTLVTEYTGIAEAGTATSLTDSTIAGTYADNFFNGYTLKITEGTGVGQTATVTDYTGSSGKFDFSGGLSGSSTPDTTTEYRITKSADSIDADGGRYLLTQYFGAVTGPITYARESNVGVDIDWRNESLIRQLREDSRSYGYPYMAAIRGYGTRQFELLVWPYPSTTLTVEFPYEIKFDKAELEGGVADSGSSTTLVDTHLNKYADNYFNGWLLTILNGTGKGETATITDFDQSDYKLTFTALSGGSSPGSTSEYMLEPALKYTPIPSMFDDVVMHACLARMEMGIDDASGGYVEYYHKKALPQAYSLDAQLAPRKLGSLNKGDVPLERERLTVTYN